MTVRTASDPDAVIDIAVVGAGVAGLTAALACAERGLRVQVFEREPIPGGRARSWCDDATGDLVDIGPHILLTEYANFRALLERLGKADQVCWHRDKFLQLFDGRHRVDVRLAPLPPPLHLAPLLVQPPLGWGARLSNARFGWLAMRFDEDQVPEFDRIDAETLLRRYGVHEQMIDWVWRTTCMTLMNVPLERCSAAALLRVFAMMTGVSGFHAGFARCGLSELYAWPAVDQIARCGGHVRLGTTVAAVEPEGTAFLLRLANGERCRARHCIVTVPPQQLGGLLPSAWRALPAVAASTAFRPSEYLCTYLWFDRRLPVERFWSQVWSPHVLNYDFYDLTAIRNGWSSRNGSVISANAMYAQRCGPLSDEEVIAQTRHQLALAVPAAREAGLLHARVHRIAMGIPCPSPGTEVLRPQVDTGVPGLYLAGDWTATHLPASMESAARSGWTVAERILAREGRAVTLAHQPARPRGLTRLARGMARRARR